MYSLKLNKLLLFAYFNFRKIVLSKMENVSTIIVLLALFMTSGAFDPISMT